MVLFLKIKKSHIFIIFMLNLLNNHKKVKYFFLLCLYGCTSSNQNLHTSLPRECKGLKKHVSMYWHYDQEQNLYVYTPDSLTNFRIENYKDCFCQYFDTTMIYRLLGKPFDKDTKWCTYCLTTSKIGASRCYEIEFNEDGKVINFKYSLIEWIE